MNQRLDEIYFLRPMTILLLVVMHAFTMYAGNWPLPDGIQPVRAYFWVQQFSYSCMLEMFVLISGYVFGFQLFGQRREYSFTKLLYSKFRRLIIPSMVFSFIFMLCFSDFVSQHQWKTIIHVTIAGYSHLWFLPMLFWCFIGGWAINKYKINDIAALAVLLILSIFSHIHLYLQLDNACYYLFFFYLGMVTYKYRERMINMVNTNTAGIYLSFVVYVILVILHTRTIEEFSAADAIDMLDRTLVYAQINTCRISYALMGVMTIYLIVLRLVSKWELPEYVVKINSYCFGIYIFQQFVFMILYYNSPFPQLVGTYWLPWVGVFVTLVVSCLATRILLCTRIGKYLL